MVPLPEQARGGMAAAEASTTTVRTVITGPSTGSGQAGEGALEEAAGVLEGFEGVRLDAEAEAAIAAALEACAARARAAYAAREKGGIAAMDADEDDPGEPFVRVHHGGPEYRGELVSPVTVEDFVRSPDGERPWTDAGAEVVEWVASGEDGEGQGPSRK